MSSAQIAHTFKIVLVGDGGVGKSTFVNRLRTGKFKKKYVATMGVEVHPVTFHTTAGPVKLNIWDTAGQEKFGGLKDGYYIGAQGFIIMCDLTSTISQKNVTKWLSAITRVENYIPIVCVANKNDCEEVTERKRSTAHVLSGFGNINYMSVKDETNFKMLILNLIRALLRDQTINFAYEEHHKFPKEVDIEESVVINATTDSDDEVPDLVDPDDEKIPEVTTQVPLTRECRFNVVTLQPKIANKYRMEEFDVILCGDGDVGKTTLVRSGSIKVSKSRNCDRIYSIVFRTTIGNVKLNVHDSNEITEDYLCQENIRSAIIMCATDSLKSQENCKNYVKDFKNAGVDYSFPTVIACNKGDLRNDYPVKSPVNGVYFTTISTKTRMNVDEPFLYLIRSLMGNDDIYIKSF